MRNDRIYEELEYIRSKIDSLNESLQSILIQLGRIAEQYEGVRSLVEIDRQNISQNQNEIVNLKEKVKKLETQMGIVVWIVGALIVGLLGEIIKLIIGLIGTK